MKLRKIRAALPLLAILLLCACGKKEAENATSPTPEPSVTAAVATPSGQPTATVTATVTPTPTEEITPTPTTGPTPTPTEVLPKAVSYEIVEMVDARNPNGFYDWKEDRPLTKLVLKYQIDGDTFETFDSEAYKERDQKGFSIRAEQLRKEMAAEFTGKMLLHSKRVAAINLNDIGIFEIYEHAAYGYAGIGCMEKPKNLDAPVVFYARMEYRLRAIVTDGDYSHDDHCSGIICEVTWAEDIAKYESVTGDFQLVNIDGTLKAIEVTLEADRKMSAESNPFGYVGTLEGFGRAFFLPDGTPIVFTEFAQLFFLPEIGAVYLQPLGAYIFTPANQILFSEANEDWQIMAFRASDLQKSFRLFAERVEDEGRYPVQHFLQKLDDQKRYCDEYELGDGSSLILRVSGADVHESGLDWYVRYEGGRYYEFYDSVLPIVETKTDAAGNKLSSMLLQRDEYSADLVKILLSEKNANEEVLAQFDSEQYRAEHRVLFAESAAACENELKAAYRGTVLLREKVLESIEFPGFGRLDVCEIAAYGELPKDVGSDRLFAYIVRCCLFDSEGKPSRCCYLFDSHSGRKVTGATDSASFSLIASLGDPLTEVSLRRYLYGDNSELYNDTSYSALAWFDPQGNPLLYGEDCWGEATDYYWVPGDIALRGVDGTEYFSNKSGKVFDYTLEELGKAFQYAAEQYSKLMAMETKLPKDKIQWRKEEGGSLRFFFEDSRKVSDELEILFSTSWYYDPEDNYGNYYYTYVLTLRYRGEEIPFAEYRYYYED